MAAQNYTLRFKNRSGSQHDFLCYQQGINVNTPYVYTLAWFAKPVANGVDVDFTWSIDYSFVWSEQGTLMFGHGWLLTLGLIGTGAITSVPLMLFARAARSLTLITLGVMQYIAPSIQFFVGILLYGETLSPERWASFMLIWIALALFVWDSLRGRRRALP